MVANFQGKEFIMVHSIQPGFSFELPPHTLRKLYIYPMPGADEKEII
jgi:hypothetical protein